MNILLFLIMTAAAPLDETHPGAEAFVAEMVAEHGFERRRLEKLLLTATRQQSIIDAISRPAEGMPWHRYRKIFMTDARIAGGVAFVARHEKLLAELEDRYGVPAELVAGIIGVETNYGTITGSYRVLDALVTLGFHYPPRASFFRSELEHLLLLERDEAIDLTTVKGSYAGAMGLGQFIPSSYRAYAVDHDADGQRDLWTSEADAIASVANYLHEHHWAAGEPVAHPVKPTDDARVLNELSLKPEFPVNQFSDWGYAVAEPAPAERLATLIKLEGEAGPLYFLGYQNFYVITRYNRSPLYAMAVHQLSQAIAAQRQAAVGP